MQAAMALFNSWAVAYGKTFDTEAQQVTAGCLPSHYMV